MSCSEKKLRMLSSYYAERVGKMSIAHHEISHDHAEKIVLPGSGELGKEFVKESFLAFEFCLLPYP